MTIDEAALRLKSGLPEVAAEIRRKQAGDPWLEIPAGSVAAVLRFLRDEMGFVFLSNLSGIDYGTSMAVTYHLARLDDADCLAVKAILPCDAAAVDSVSSLYGNAGWFEREAFDLLGILFVNHGDLRRLMMPDDWEGHPLRKDYVPPAEYHGIPCDRPDSHGVLDVLYPKREGSVPESGKPAQG
jgi:NADH-quinone oxidoreductase subunit C